MELIETSAVINVPEHVAVCPYCGGKLTARFESWEQCDDGTWRASQVDLECETQPELDEDDPERTAIWDDWLAEHTYMPYVNWLPVTVEVEKWVNRHYRFKCD